MPYIPNLRDMLGLSGGAPPGLQGLGGGALTPDYDAQESELIRQLGLPPEQPTFEAPRPKGRERIAAGLADVLWALGRGVGQPSSIGATERLRDRYDRMAFDAGEEAKSNAQGKYQARQRELLGRLQQIQGQREREAGAQGAQADAAAREQERIDAALAKQAEEDFAIRKMTMEHDFEMEKLREQAKLKPKEGGSDKPDPDYKGRAILGESIDAINILKRGVETTDPVTGAVSKAPSWKDRIKAGIQAGKDRDEIANEIAAEALDEVDANLVQIPHLALEFKDRFEKAYRAEEAKALKELEATSGGTGGGGNGAIAPASRNTAMSKLNVLPNIGGTLLDAIRGAYRGTPAAPGASSSGGFSARIPTEEELLAEEAARFNMTVEQFKAAIGRR